MKKYVVDTSVVIDGRITDLLEKGKIEGEVLIPNALIAELESQANKGRETGFSGLFELQALRRLADGGKVKLRYVGTVPSWEDLRLGRVDAIIRDLARRHNATLITSDRVQAEVARAIGIDVMFLEKEVVTEKPDFERWFDEKTLSVHLKENTEIVAKRGKPGKLKLVGLKEIPSRQQLEQLASDIIELTKRDPNSFIEIDRKGAVVVQYREYRIAICRPPFSDGFEITIVRPMRRIPLSEWHLSKKLTSRIEKEASGIIIAGPPGSGKSTLACALAEFYAQRGAVVKTMESPRDLQVSDAITQYAPLEGDFEKTADILLLARPDYTIYDEMRKSRDFKIYADLRLAGVGMIGVVHATRPIDAIQRMIGRLELGMIPQIVDTVIFVKGAQIEKVYALKFAVKLPHGMTEKDLTRPVVEVRDFETGELEYEIYTYGEQTVVVPIREAKADRAERIRRTLSQYVEGQIEVLSDRVVVHTTPANIRRLLKRRRIRRLEKMIGMPIELVS